MENQGQHRGVLAKDLPPEKLEKLLRAGYTISPTSGRLRKKIKEKRKRSPFSKRKTKKFTRIFLWIVLLIAFLASLVMVVPELTYMSNPKNEYQKQQMRKR